MTKGKLWQNIMHYGEFDRMPVIHWSEWGETRERWIKEGMPAEANEHEYFRAQPMWLTVGAVNVNLRLPSPHAPYDYTAPGLMEEIETTEEFRVYKDYTGVVWKAWKDGRSGMEQCLSFSLNTAKDWDKFKERLQPDPPRVRNDLDEYLQKLEDTNDLPVVMDNASLMGCIRNWMGLENMAYLMYDDPSVYSDMITTIADLVCWAMDQVIPKMKTKTDMGHVWEDICYKSGPLISPEFFKKYVAPGYRKIRDKLEQYGVTLLGVDSDGYIEPLLKHWLDAGANVLFSLEIGTWNADPMELRKKFGKDLRMLGGLNKLVLEKGRSEIDAEIERRKPLMEDGGYVIMPDHAVTPGTSLENYKYYLEKIRNIRL